MKKNNIILQESKDKKRPDFQNMTEEERVEFEKNRPEKLDSKNNRKEDINKQN